MRGVPGSTPDCGTVARYQHGCRCEACARANMVRQKARTLGRLRGEQVWVDRCGVIRRINALRAIGWTPRMLGDRLGISEQAVRSLCANPKAPAHITTVAVIRDLYDDLSMTPGPSVAGRRTAARYHFAPPLAWDDDTIDDPAARPNLGRSERGQDIDDIAWLVDCGGTWETVAARCGITTDGVDVALRRAGRLDLIARLTRAQVAS